MRGGKSIAHLFAYALILLKRGDPLPIDLETRLIQFGINVAALRERIT